MKKITFMDIYTKEFGMREPLETRKVLDRDFKKINLGANCIGFTYYDCDERLKKIQDGHEIFVSKEKSNVEKYMIGRVSEIAAPFGEDGNFISRCGMVYSLPQDTKILSPELFEKAKEQE